MSTLSIGVDVGNYATKTQHTETISGYMEQQVQPQTTNEWLKYEDTYYIPLNESFAYSYDKTENGRALILTLFAIAKEILFVVKNDREYGRVSTQELINRHHDIKLGIGLPPGHLDNLKVKTVDYYNNAFGKEINYIYCTHDCGKEQEFEFKIRLDALNLYPQDFMAVYNNPDCQLIKQFNSYYIIGIGGYTVDIVEINDGRPNPSSFVSMELGTNIMYREIAKNLKKLGLSVATSTIEDELKGIPTILPDDAKEQIRKDAQLYTNKIIDNAGNNNVMLSSMPVIFFGGGCLLLREYLLNNKCILKSEFIEDIHSNAIAYARMNDFR